MGLIKNVMKKVKNAVTESKSYSMETQEDRESQVQEDFETAKLHRQPQDKKWIELDNLYHNRHKSSILAKVMEAKGEVPYELPTLTDAFVQVESQIDPIVPDFQFKGRDGDLDSIKARSRTDVVKYICYNNKLERQNVENERSLCKLGNAFWKASWNPNVKGPGFIGDIEIGNPSPTNIFPDPSAYEIEQCEYIDYPYRLHRRAAKRKWGDVIDNIGSSASHYDTEIFDGRDIMVDDETVQVVEHWYKDMEGDIACSIQVEGTEVQFIPKFWEKTRHSGNQMYPIIKYCKIPQDQAFWDISEIELIKDLINAEDMEFMTALLNDHFMANDIIIYEEGALVEGYEIKHIPGEEIPLNSNKIDKIRRLGGVSNNSNLVNMMSFIKDRIEETTGNASTQQGIEPSKVTTFRGIAALNERADKRKNIKKFDRLKGFEELYKLLDWMALEFYDDNRTVIIRGKTKEEEDAAFEFDSTQLLMQNSIGEQYFPSIDCEVSAGDGINKSKSFTMEVVSELIKTPISIQNIGLVEVLIDILELPNADELKTKIKEGLQQAMMPQGMPMGGGMPGGGMPQGMPNGGNNPQNPQAPQDGGGANMVEQLIQSMSPDEWMIFKNKTDEQKMEIIQRLMSDGGIVQGGGIGQ